MRILPALLLASLLAMGTRSWPEPPAGGGMTEPGQEDLAAFLWGDEHHLLHHAGPFPETPSRPGGREGLLRLVHTEHAFRELHDPGEGEPSTDRTRPLEHSLLWRWLALWAGEAAPAEEELQAVHTLRRDEFVTPETFSFQRLFLPAGDGERAHPEREMEKLRGELLAGRSPAEVIGEHGLPEHQGRVLGPFRPGTIDPMLEQALNALAPGEISPVLVSDKGAHVLLLVSREKSSAVPFEEARSMILREFLRPEMAALFETLQAEASEAGLPPLEDETVHLFLKSVSGQDLSAESAAQVGAAILHRAREQPWSDDGEAALVRQWAERRRQADRAFAAHAEEQVQRRIADGERVMGLLEEIRARPAGNRRFSADYLVVRQRETSPGDRRALYEAHRQAEELAAMLAESWREGGLSPEEAGALPEEVTFHRTSGTVTIPQAGRQLTEAVRGLGVGDVGKPVHSRASGTFLVARLTGTEKPEPSTDDGYTEREEILLRNHFLREIKEEFREEAEYHLLGELKAPGPPQENWNARGTGTAEQQDI